MDYQKMINSSKKYAIVGAKTGGKYTLKGLGKALEWTARGGIKTVDALVKNKDAQKIATGAGMLAASVMIPSVGTAALTLLATKYMMDRYLLGKQVDLMDSALSLVNMGNKVTGLVCDKVFDPALKFADKETKDLGKSAQDWIDQNIK